MWIVIWCYKTAAGSVTDGWSAHETLEEARQIYQECLAEDDIYSVSLCAPIESTDYDNPLG